MDRLLKQFFRVHKEVGWYESVFDFLRKNDYTLSHGSYPYLNLGRYQF